MSIHVVRTGALEPRGRGLRVCSDERSRRHGASRRGHARAGQFSAQPVFRPSRPEAARRHGARRGRQREQESSLCGVRGAHGSFEEQPEGLLPDGAAHDARRAREA